MVANVRKDLIASWVLRRKIFKEQFWKKKKTSPACQNSQTDISNKSSVYPPFSHKKKWQVREGDRRREKEGKGKRWAAIDYSWSVGTSRQPDSWPQTTEPTTSCKRKIRLVGLFRRSKQSTHSSLQRTQQVACRWFFFFLGWGWEQKTRSSSLFRLTNHSAARRMIMVNGNAVWAQKTGPYGLLRMSSLPAASTKRFRNKNKIKKTTCISRNKQPRQWTKTKIESTSSITGREDCDKSSPIKKKISPFTIWTAGFQTEKSNQTYFFCKLSIVESHETRLKFFNKRIKLQQIHNQKKNLCNLKKKTNEKNPTYPNKFYRYYCKQKSFIMFKIWMALYGRSHTSVWEKSTNL